MKAEVFDFESTAKSEAPAAGGNTSQEVNSQTKRRKTPSSNPLLTQSFYSKAFGGPTQQSILSFLPASSNVPEGRVLAERSRGTPDVPSHGTATTSDIVNLEPEERENVRAKLGRGLPGSSIDGNGAGKITSVGEGCGGGNGDALMEPRKADLASIPSFSQASAGSLSAKAKRGGQRVDKRNNPNAEGPGWISKSAGHRMGQALTEWSWEYFCTLWGAEELVGDDAVSPTSRPGESASSAGAEVASNRAPDGEKAGKATPTAAVLSRADAPRPWKANTDGGPTAGAAGPGSGAAGAASSGGGGGSRSARGDDGATEGGGGGRTMGAAPDAVRRRPPPPLYFQHDGHSRSVVGVLWQGGRGKSGKECGGRAAGSGDGIAGRGRGFEKDGSDRDRRGGGGVGSGGGGGAGGRGSRLQPGSLLIFDPSHSGSEIRRALDDTQQQRWGR